MRVTAILSWQCLISPWRFLKILQIRQFAQKLSTNEIWVLYTSTLYIFVTKTLLWKVIVELWLGREPTEMFKSDDYGFFQYSARGVNKVSEYTEVTT